MYDERISDFSQSKDETSISTTLSLTHSYGYEFSYKGNGIDAMDKEEIAVAMKLISPMMEEYLKNTQSSSPSEAEITNTAFDINRSLPHLKNNDSKNYLNEQLLKNIDKALEKRENQNEKILQNAQRLFEKLLKQQVGFELYI